MELWNLQNVKLVKVGLSSSELRNEQDVGAWVVASRQSDSCLLGASPSQCRDDLFGCVTSDLFCCTACANESGSARDYSTF